MQRELFLALFALFIGAWWSLWLEFVKMRHLKKVLKNNEARIAELQALYLEENPTAEHLSETLDHLEQDQEADEAEMKRYNIGRMDDQIRVYREESDQ